MVAGICGDAHVQGHIAIEVFIARRGYSIDFIDGYIMGKRNQADVLMKGGERVNGWKF